MTPRQQDVLSYVRRRLFEDGQAPTLTEIAEEIGLCSKVAAHTEISAIVAEGRLVRTPNTRRGLALPATGPLDRFSTQELREEIERRETLS